MEETVALNNEKNTHEQASLIIIMDEGRERTTVKLDGTMTLGRCTEQIQSDIPLESKIVSRQHGIFMWDAKKKVYMYSDQGSKNGTYLNGELLECNTKVELNEGDTLRINSEDLANVDKKSIIMIYVLDYNEEQNKWKGISLKSKDITIGRNFNNFIYLADKRVSQEHAVLTKADEGWFIKNLSEKNGVLLNGENVPKDNVELLSIGDVLKIADTIFIYLGDEIIYNRKNSNGESLSIHINKKSVKNRGVLGKEKVLLKDISVDIECGDMVLILGGSGAGKTTFMNAVVGNDVGKRGLDGKILLGKSDIYKNHKALSPKIAYAPQFPVARECEKVGDVVRSAAKMKMLRGSKNIEEKVDETLETLGISSHKDKLFKQLSGGQQKRVSIALGMVSDPSLFFLDEPDSGLDGSTGRKLMEDLDHLSSMGKIVMVISHAPGNAEDLFSKVIVLAKSNKEKIGRLAYCGSVNDTRKFFGVDKLQDIMQKINPIEEGGEGRADEFIQRFEEMRKNG